MSPETNDRGSALEGRAAELVAAMALGLSRSIRRGQADFSRNAVQATHCEKAGLAAALEDEGVPQAPQIDPPAIPDDLVEQVFANEEAQDMLRQVMSATGLDGAPADLPMETKKAIVAMLIQNGVIQLGDDADANIGDA